MTTTNPTTNPTINFQLTLNLMAEVNCSEPDPENEDFDRLLLIKGFIKEFIKHPEALHAFYRDYLIETFFYECEEIDRIIDNLGYQHDFKDIFVDIAAACSPEVQQFIQHIYSTNPSNKATITIEKLRELLNDQFGALKVTAAEFKALD